MKASSHHGAVRIRKKHFVDSDKTIYEFRKTYWQSKEYYTSIIDKDANRRRMAVALQLCS